MNREDIQMKAEQLADKMGDLLTEEKTPIEVVMSVFVSLLVTTALNQAGMTGVQLLRLLGQAVEKYEDHTKEMEEKDEQVISRATH